jgi:hypothetical protein
LIDPRLNPAEHAQAPMFLHDTAQVLGRPDLALGFARRALRALPGSRPGNAGPPDVIRLRINAIFAEIVTLNTLGLQAGVTRRLMDVYLSRMASRGIRNAGRLASDLHQAVTRNSGAPPLRRAQILRTLIRYHRPVADPTTATGLIAECLKVTAEANLVHQRDELVSELT